VADGNPFRLDDRVAVITGGGTGVGAATAMLFAEHGADVVLAARHADELERVADAVGQRTGRRALPVVTDVRSDGDITRLVDRVSTELGRVDVLVNNAGGTSTARLAEASTASIDKVIGLNLRGPTILTREVGKLMMRQRSGTIVNVSSNAGVVGMKGGAAYSSAKAGLQMLTRVAAAEFGPYGIRVNCVALGPIASERVIKAWQTAALDEDALAARLPLRRVGLPVEVARCILFLASPASSYVTGQTLNCDGGPVMGGLD